MVVTRRDADGDLVIRAGIELRRPPCSRPRAAGAALVRDGEQALGREPVEVVGGERSADAGGGRRLFAADRR
jgi:hypothetical protein